MTDLADEHTTRDTLRDWSDQDRRATRPVVELSCDFQFEASHQLPYVPPGHKCGRLHGHSYHLTAKAAGPVDAHMGWVCDFGDIKALVRPLVARLDHQHLNDFCHNPTVENLLVWMWGELGGSGIITELTLSETGKSRATYRGEHR